MKPANLTLTGLNGLVIRGGRTEVVEKFVASMESIANEYKRWRGVFAPDMLERRSNILGTAPKLMKYATKGQRNRIQALSALLA